MLTPRLVWRTILLATASYHRLKNCSNIQQGRYHQCDAGYYLSSTTITLNKCVLNDHVSRNSNTYINIIRVSNSRLPMQYSFDQISNNITCENSFSLFLPILNLLLKIPNHHCDPNRYIINLIPKLNNNNSLPYHTSSILQSSWTFPSISESIQVVSTLLCPSTYLVYPNHPRTSLVYLTQLK